MLQEKKTQGGVDIIESKMPSMTLGGVTKYLDYLNENDNRSRLHALYHSSWYLRKSWDMKKAQTACYDYGIKAILRLVDGKSGNE
jgi:hypothetical protein